MGLPRVITLRDSKVKKVTGYGHKVT